jgi:hypothetical protein
MKKIIRLTESDLVRLVKRVISEQGIPEGYIETTPNNNNKGVVISKMIKKYGDNYKYYINEKNRVSFISDGNTLIFVSAPQNVTLGPHKLRDVIKDL